MKLIDVKVGKPVVRAAWIKGSESVSWEIDADTRKVVLSFENGHPRKVNYDWFTTDDWEYVTVQDQVSHLKEKLADAEATIVVLKNKLEIKE